MNYLSKSFLMLLIISNSNLAAAQEANHQLNTFNPETRESYEKTQKLINKTRTKLNLIRNQHNARAREIEALTNKVGVIITKMSGQGEDNTALQSEISVLDELLIIERKVTGDLRTKNIRLTEKLNEIRIQNNSNKIRYDETKKRNETKFAEAEKRISTMVSAMAKQKNTTKQLEENIKTLAAEVIRLRKQVKLLKKNRYRSKLRVN
ncbi:MAG: hypothetical protein VX693_12370 [Pseudomonadota bacterium]|nr:hypothetical protein [Pseudomonadota bacterium]